MRLVDFSECAIADEFAFQHNKRLAYCWAEGVWLNKEGGLIKDGKRTEYWRRASKNRLLHEIGSLCLRRARELEECAMVADHPHLILQVASAAAIEGIERLLKSHAFFDFATVEELELISDLKVVLEPPG